MLVLVLVLVLVYVARVYKCARTLQLHIGGYGLREKEKGEYGFLAIPLCTCVGQPSRAAPVLMVAPGAVVL